MSSYFSKNRHFWAMLFLGFSSGLPLALTNSTLQAWFTDAGVNLLTIGVLSLVGLPYIWKFLWAPVMDRFVPPFFGRRRGWIALSQIFLCASLFFIARLNPVNQGWIIGLLALLIAFLSASQDIAIDAYRTDILAPEERSVGSAIFIFSCRIALLFSGGFSLILADHLGWQTTYELMAVILGVLVLATYWSPTIKNECLPPQNFYAAVVEPFLDLLKRDDIFLILLFIILYKIGAAFAVALMSNFLLKGLGFSLTDVGIAYKFGGFIATILGAFVGGLLLTRISLYRGLLFFGIAQAFSNLTFILLALVGKNYFLMFSSLFIENFCTGLSTTALLVFLTSLCHQQYSATQFACLSALDSIGRVFLGPLAAAVVLHWGWVSFYAWSFVLCFPGLIVLTLLRNKVKFNVPLAA